MYYFAYGSNMSHKQMSKRCPGAKFLKAVYLEGYKFVYDGHSRTRNGAVANIVKSNGDVVWGALYKVKYECIRALDRYEGYPNIYQRKFVKLQDQEGNEYIAFVYLRLPQEMGTPSKEYRDVVLEGAKDCNLPEDYISRYI